jgi:hypothetical protein
MSSTFEGIHARVRSLLFASHTFALPPHFCLPPGTCAFLPLHCSLCRGASKSKSDEAKKLKALDREKEKEEKLRKVDEEKRLRQEARKLKLQTEREAREALKKKDQEDRRLAREADRKKRRDEKEQQKDLEQQNKDQQARDRGKEDTLFPFQPDALLPTPKAFEWDPCIKTLVDIDAAENNEARMQMLPDALSLLEFFCTQSTQSDEGLFIASSSLFTFADLTRILFGQDKEAIKLAFRMHKILMLVLREEDQIKKVSYTEWFAGMPITVATFQTVLLKFLETHKLFCNANPGCITSLREGEYCAMPAVHRLTILLFLRDSALLTERARRQQEKFQDDIIELEKKVRALESEQHEVLRSFIEAPDSSLKGICLSLFEEVLREENPDNGLTMTAVFMEPVPRDVPDYYKTVEHPFCLNEIKVKIDEDQYSTFEECYDDFMLVWSNALLYNQEGSAIYGHAYHLNFACEQSKRRLQARCMLMEEAKAKQKEIAAKLAQQGNSAAVVANDQAAGMTIAHGTSTIGGTGSAMPPQAAVGVVKIEMSQLTGGIDGEAGGGGAEDAFSPEAGRTESTETTSATTASRGRRTRANSRKLPAYVTEIEDLKARVAKENRRCKTELLGCDRYMNQYYLMEALPGIHVQARLYYAGEVATDLAMTLDTTDVPPINSEATPTPREPNTTSNESAAELANRIAHEKTNPVNALWSRIIEDKDLEMLLSNLNPQGAREGGLLSSLQSRHTNIMKSLDAARLQEKFPVSASPPSDSGVNLVAEKTRMQLMDIDRNLQKKKLITSKPSNPSGGQQDDGNVYDHLAWKEKTPAADNVTALGICASELAQHTAVLAKSYWGAYRAEWLKTVVECRSYADLAFHLMVFENAVTGEKIELDDGDDMDDENLDEVDATSSLMWAASSANDTCRACLKGGMLLWCDSCPNSYHKECLDLDEEIDDNADWFCRDCNMAKPLVWAKVRGYPKWPAKVLHQSGAKFSLWFFGTHETLDGVSEKALTAYTGDEKGEMTGSKKETFVEGIKEVTKYANLHRTNALKSGRADPTRFGGPLIGPENFGACSFASCTMTKKNGEQYCTWHTGAIPASPVLNGTLK